MNQPQKVYWASLISVWPTLARKKEVDGWKLNYVYGSVYSLWDSYALIEYRSGWNDLLSEKVLLQETLLQETSRYCIVVRKRSYVTNDSLKALKF